MNALFEYSDKLNAPYECFVFDASVEQFPIQPHWHYFMEIIYMLEGTALMNCDDQSFVVEEGDLVLFLPHQIHSIYAVANMTLKYYVMKFDVGQLSSSVDDFTPKTAIHFPSMLRAAKGDPAAEAAFSFFRARRLRRSKISLRDFFNKLKNPLLRQGIFCFRRFRFFCFWA